jgi:hypothetical protein
MSFLLKPDYEVVKKRYEAFWECEIVDRALVCLPIPAAEQQPVPQKTYATEEERWTDVEFRSERLAAELRNVQYLGDALPIAWPNMGPEIFSAWCGCGYNYGKHTTWSDPCILDWDSDAEKAVFDMNHELFKLTDRFTDRLLELGRGNFIVGLTDFHPGGDHLAALRDPANLAIDMIDNLDWVKKKLTSSYPEYYRAYNHFYEKLRAADMPITSWAALIHEGKYYIPSNDFSCMIGDDMFHEVFLPGIVEECSFYDRSLYHLDGPGALRYLDTLLAIDGLNAIQWVPGAGNEGFGKWIDVYKRIQAAGKGMQITSLTVDDLPLLFEQLKPEGVYVSGVYGVNSEETAETVLKRFAAWK